MTTIVNNPTPVQVQSPTSSGSGYGLVVGGLVLLVFLALALYFGIPAIKNLGPMQVNVPAPQINVAAPQVVVPDKVDVNVVPAK